MKIEVMGIDLDVEIDTYPPHRGARDSLGVPLEPDEGADYDINAIMSGTQDILDLIGDKAMEMINREITAELAWQQHNE